MFWRLSRIGVMEITGVISSGRGTTDRLRLLEILEKSPRYKAVVLDIDSPGGTASASEYLHNAVAKVAARKPVIAFIRNIGASGAYMISCAATRTIAFPSAIVGSIGVISISPILQELMQRLGVSVSVTKGGHLKDMGAFYREPTPEEEQKEKELVEAFYDRFLEIVANGRKLDKEKVRGYATGEVFLGTKAKELGLVDEVGDMDAALDEASRLGNVPRRVSYLRPHRSFRERLLLGAADSLVERLTGELESLLARRICY